MISPTNNIVPQRIDGNLNQLQKNISTGMDNVSYFNDSADAIINNHPENILTALTSLDFASQEATTETKRNSDLVQSLDAQTPKGQAGSQNQLSNGAGAPNFNIFNSSNEKNIVKTGKPSEKEQQVGPDFSLSQGQLAVNDKLHNFEKINNDAEVSLKTLEESAENKKIVALDMLFKGKTSIDKLNYNDPKSNSGSNTSENFRSKSNNKNAFDSHSTGKSDSKADKGKGIFSNNNPFKAKLN